MPPKAQQQPSKKTEQKRKEKIIEDKTFGLKNKKGNKNQKFVQQVQNQMRNQTPRADAAKQAAVKKDKELDELLDLNNLLRPVEQKISKDVDPKSLVCVFFKQGLCGKGNKCKFSHDLSVEQKTAKKNLYVDSRDLGEEDDNMDDWDQEKLNSVVTSKHGTENKNNQTEIVCKFFIQAVEDSKYGWFWECPNGGNKCQYRHCLPEGYVLKKDRKRLEDQQKENEISIEELVETQRAALSSKNLTKITLQSFIAWKKRKLRERKQKEEDELKAKKEKIKTGKQLGMSGRDLFTFDASLIADDDEAGDVEFEKEEVDPDEKVFEIDANFFKFEGMDDELDEEMSNSTTAAEAAAGGVSKMKINEDLFDVDEDVEGLDSDDDS